MIKVFIDPGHGGKDRANRGPTGYIEADGVLDISLLLEKELLSTGAFQVGLSRRTDITLGLSERGRAAAEFGAQLFISEHTNAAGMVPNTTVRGTTVYESVDLKDEALGAQMSKSIAAALGIPDRGCHQRESVNYPGEDYYTVIDTAQDAGVPHVLLIESAFHDNADDEALLKSEAGLLKIARAQAAVICGFFGVKYPANKGMTVAEAIDIWAAAGVILDPDGMKKDFETGVFRPDRYSAFLIKSASFITNNKA
ncbi:MAG: N-acetylmuramoyl-L-alanine amidase [Ruminiclostridium sp.]|nr:N-acetylmuramoyl-L-alanine amidase [Ruminiclostridium sp.]